MKHVLTSLLVAVALQFAHAQSTLLTLTTDADSKDAVIETYAPNLNGGNDDVVFVSAWTNGGAGNNKRYLIEFDFSAIPANAVIDSAKLDLYKGNTPLMSNMHQGSNSWSIRRITQSWGEQTVTWNNQPISTSLNKTVVPATTSAYQDFLNLDVTALVVDAISVGNFGFVCQLETETPYKAVLLTSSDHSIVAKRPLLKVYYSSCIEPEVGFNKVVNGTTVHFADTTNSSTIISRLWDFGDGTFSNLPNPIKTYNTASTYTVCLFITDSCGSDTTCEQLSLCAPAVPTIYYNSNGLQVQFQAQPINALSYWWNFGDGNFTTQQNPLYTYSAAGTYEVCLATTDACGTDTTCMNIAVSAIGLEENALNQFVLYPNPASSHFYLGGNLSEIEKVSLYNVIGKAERIITNLEERIDISDLKAGFYFIKIETHHGEALDYKLVKH